MKPTVVVAEDNLLVLEGSLLPLLEHDFDVVATASNGEQALEAARTLQPAILLLDVSLPVLRGWDVARQLVPDYPGISVLFVSNYSQPEYADEAMRVGAKGYVLKSRVRTDLIPAIQSALRGQFFRSEMPERAAPSTLAPPV